MQRRLVVPAVLVACLAAGCHAGGSTAAVSSATGGPVVSTGAASAPIAVTVAPALVAPGAVHSGTPMLTVPAVPAPSVPKTPSRATVACPTYLMPKQIPLQVSTTSGTATVSWGSDGDTTVTSYRVAAVSQRLVSGSQPAPTTATAASGAGCPPLSLTLRGLSHGVPYVFWLEEGSVAPANGALRYTLVGQSAAVIVP